MLAGSVNFITSGCPADWKKKACLVPFTLCSFLLSLQNVIDEPLMIQAAFLQVYLQTSAAWIEVLIYVHSLAICAVLVVL